MLKMRSVAISLLRREVLVHKLRYSKTLRADWAGALLGAICGLFVGYLGLASVGAVAVELGDLTSLTLVVACLVSSVITLSRALRSSARVTHTLCVLSAPLVTVIRAVVSAL